MQEENDNIKEKKEIEIVSGDSKDLNISDVKDNLIFEVHDKDIKGEVIIPENQKNKNIDNQ